MFETAILRKHGQAFTSLDKGLIAETPLFYSNVHIVAHFGVLIRLLKAFGVDTLLRLLDDKRLTLTYLRRDFGTATINSNGIEYHSFGEFEQNGPRKKRASNEEIIQLAFERALGKSWHTHRMAKKFLNKISVRRDITIPNEKRGLPGLATSDLNDTDFVRQAVRGMLSEMVPGFVPRSDFHFHIFFADDGSFIVNHNINFQMLNAMYKAAYPLSDATLTPALIVDQLLEARVDLHLASTYMAEIVTNGPAASIVHRKVSSIMGKRDKNLADIQLFQETQLCDARAIREAINSGEHSFDDYLKILDEADRFKEWLRSRNPDANLLSEYYRAVTAETWIDRLPTRSWRLVIAFGIAAALEHAYPSGLGLLTGLGVEAADHLLLDRLLKGWRPNQFVEGPLSQIKA